MEPTDRRTNDGPLVVKCGVDRPHGIAQEQCSADVLEGKWLPALAGGVRNAGYPDIADRLWRLGAGPGSIEARMAFYGKVFLKPDQQGVGAADLDSDETDIAEQLALEWLEHAATRSPNAADRGEAAASGTGGRVCFIVPFPPDPSRSWRAVAAAG